MQNLGFKGLIVYQKSYEMVKEVYKLINSLPDGEKYNIISQIKRASTSVSLNIAEGYSRKELSAASYKNFLIISKGSAFEMQVLLDLCRDLKYIDAEYAEIYDGYTEILKMLSGIIRKIT